MTLLWILRLALYLTFSLGIGRFLGFLPGRGVWELHIVLGVVIAILALIALRPLPARPGDRLRLVARFFPLLPLALGLALLFKLVGGTPVVLIHLVLGIATIGLVEAAAARQRRALA